MNLNFATKDAKLLACDGKCGFPIHSHFPNRNSVKLIKNMEYEQGECGKELFIRLPRMPFVNCCQFMYLVISFLVLRAGCGI